MRKNSTLQRVSILRRFRPFRNNNASVGRPKIRLILVSSPLSLGQFKFRHYLRYFKAGLLLTFLVWVGTACALAPPMESIEAIIQTEEPAPSERTTLQASPDSDSSTSVFTPEPTAPPLTPIVLPISVYILDDTGDQFSSERTAAQLEAVYVKVNEIWAQAGIIIEVQTISRVAVQADRLQAIAAGDFRGFFQGAGTAFDLPEPSLLNGFYARQIGGPNGINPFGSRVFFVMDKPSVYSERVTSHEIGHILGLHHNLDDQNRLMFSGTNGMTLSAEEITVARYAAQGLLDGVR